MKNKNVRASENTAAPSSVPVPPPTPTPSPFLTPQQLAARWQCSVVKLRRMRKAWTLPAHTVGSHIRFMLADIEKLEAGWRTGIHVASTKEGQPHLAHERQG
ncbi:helix-turn-helix domain-containing protein [Roseimicrobium sp. ORNL1]|uniref:helix-turn-helix domain-containing protein n=1 Tax=Roseimicrobium sp. ORNL1 TaxID=2711231 RepID=UPI0013E17C41|nr:helix-turn-helix domain-containing protein [Roseimicrobium sp. ORNL1]QIF00069.1 helix-turn-helix domain-containing protein [Roseimicrobium sp. ORNL1]